MRIIIRYYFIVILSLLFSSVSFSQTGDYFLKHFSANLPNVDNDNYAIVQDGLGRMRIANRQGLLRFDGRSWSLNKTPGTVLSVKYDPISNLLFVGCVNDFGFIQTDFTGQERYVSLSKGDSKAKNIAKIEVFENFVYFLGEDILYEYAKRENSITHRYEDNVINFFSYNKNMYACYPNYTISKLGITKFSEQYFGNIPTSDIIFSNPLTKTAYVVGTVDNKIYTLSGNYFKQIRLKDSSYIENCELLDAIAMDDNTLVIATTKGGCLVVNIKTGETKSIINVYSGLLDNEVYAIGKDVSGGVWIAHEFGLSRLDYNLPFRCFSNYTGLLGHIETTIMYKEKLYVGTNEGIFMLDEIKKYSEVKEKKVTIKKKVIKAKPEVPDNTIDAAPVADNTKKKKRFTFRNLISKNKPDSTKIKEEELTKKAQKKKKKEEESVKAKKSIFAKNQVIKYKSVGESKKFILESIKHSFRKVIGADLKCTQLIICKGRLLAATNIGIFDLSGPMPEKISAEHIRYLYVSVNSPRILASTSHGNILTFQLVNEKWERNSTFDFIKQPINHISEDENGNVWLTSTNKVLRYTIDENNLAVNRYEQQLDNPFSDEIFITSLNKKLYFSLSSTYYYFDSQTQKLVRDTIIENNFKTAERIVNSQSNILWIFKNKMWTYLSDIIHPNKNYNYLSLFRNVEEMIVDEPNKATWIITSNNKLYRLNLNKNYALLTPPKVYINDIKNSMGELYGVSNFTILENESGLSMDMISTDYYDQEALEYSYKIIGLNDDWTPWSNNNTILLNHLTSGKYKIIVRSKNALGQITEKEAVKFKITPPYWQTWWFYLLEIGLFGSLWLISLRFNRKNLGNQVIRKLLTYITLILTIEFMSTVAENSIGLTVSPVVDFLVKVSIAITLFPIEQLLLKLIVKKQ